MTPTVIALRILTAWMPTSTRGMLSLAAPNASALDWPDSSFNVVVTADVRGERGRGSLSLLLPASSDLHSRAFLRLLAPDHGVIFTG